MSDLVRNPEDKFSHDAAQICNCFYLALNWKFCMTLMLRMTFKLSVISALIMKGGGQYPLSSFTCSRKALMFSGSLVLSNCAINVVGKELVLLALFGIRCLLTGLQAVNVKPNSLPVLSGLLMWLINIFKRLM